MSKRNGRLDKIERALEASRFTPPHIGIWDVVCVEYYGYKPDEVPPEPEGWSDNWQEVLDEIYGVDDEKE